MPINKIRPTNRGKAAIAGAATAVALSIGALIKPWEGKSNVAYRDIVNVLTICYGETQSVKPGMRKTDAECDRMLYERVTRDYARPLAGCIAGFEAKPKSWQAAMISLSYNVGVPTACRSTAARLARAGQLRESCEAATAFNRAGGKVIDGLVKRREMGDANRIGEAELCVSGL